MLLISTVHFRTNELCVNEGIALLLPHRRRCCLDFGLTYCPNGDLLQYITDAGRFHEDVTRFYSAELVEALEELHKRKIIHRDLKVSFRPSPFDAREAESSS